MANPVDTAALHINTLDWEDEREVDAFHEDWIDSNRAKVLDDFRRLREMGIIDASGNDIKTVVPADMLDPDADFGG